MNLKVMDTGLLITAMWMLLTNVTNQYHIANFALCFELEIAMQDTQLCLWNFQLLRVFLETGLCYTLRTVKALRYCANIMTSSQTNTTKVLLMIIFFEVLDL